MKIGGIVLALLFSAAAVAAPPRDWIDPATGHRILRLTDEPGSTSLYFNVNAFTPGGAYLAVSTPSGIATIAWASKKLRLIVPKAHLLFVGRKTGRIYFDKPEGAGTAIFTVAATGGTPRRMAQIPSGTIQALNADETELAGVEEFTTATVGRDGLLRDPQKPQSKGTMMKARLEAQIPMRIFVLDLKTGARRTLLQSTDWLNHLQFSPTDPGLLMYCHEGPWQRVDRIWLIRTDQPDAKPLKVHSRSMAMEIAGHEWFSTDGKTVWYDLQTPRGEDFWVAGYAIADGRRTWYHLERNEWSVHYNSSPDGTLFSGDGGDDRMVAHAPDGKWLYLFHPRPITAPNAGDHAAPSADLIRPGVFEAEKLVDMREHNYHLEPNATFTPDGKWLIFRANMQDGSQVYAVEIVKAK